MLPHPADSPVGEAWRTRPRGGCLQVLKEEGGCPVLRIQAHFLPALLGRRRRRWSQHCPGPIKP